MTSQYDLEPARAQLERLMKSRDHPKTFCPSEVARALSKGELERTGAASWRDLMPALRLLAFELRDEGQLEITQKGKVIASDQTLEATTGPIRLRRRIDSA